MEALNTLRATGGFSASSRSTPRASERLAPGTDPSQSETSAPPTLSELLHYALTDAHVRLNQSIPGLDTLVLRLGHEGFIISQPVIGALAGVFAAAVGLAKTNLLTLVATEFVLAKSVDYGVSKA
ncbi:MAG: hypothetical protein AAFQ82_07045, partial [Myxococcota bacterium]